MTTAEPVRVLEHVSATVKSREDKGEDGWRISVDIPSFKSTFPTILNFVPADLAQKLVPNMAVNLVLSRDKLREDKDGKPQSGKMKWHYWWRLDSLWEGKQAEPISTTPSGPEQAPTILEVSVPRRSWDDRTVDIEAAWAINQAREWIQHREEAWGENMVWLLEKAQQFLDAKNLLAGSIRSRKSFAPQPSGGPPASQTAHGEPVHPERSRREPPTPVPVLPASVGELLTRGVNELGYKGRTVMFAVLDIESVLELDTPAKLAEAWQKLVENAPKRKG